LEVREKVNKKLISERTIKGKPIEFIFRQRVEDEAEDTAKKIKELCQKRVLNTKTSQF